MKLIIISTFVFLVLLLIFYSCRKDVGKDPDIAYTDYALLDTCKNSSAFRYYKDDPNMVYPGTNGPHGTYRLKFNHRAYAQLTDGGKLPTGNKFSNGSMIVKEIVSGGTVIEYALMYKLNGAWLWAEISPAFSVKHSVKTDHGVCISCHSQNGNRDQVATFIYH
jgi:hypothetical protein